MEPRAQQPFSSQGALSQAVDIIKKRKIFISKYYNF